jgi:hypothetical protein
LFDGTENGNREHSAELEMSVLKRPTSGCSIFGGELLKLVMHATPPSDVLCLAITIAPTWENSLHSHFMACYAATQWLLLVGAA